MWLRLRSTSMPCSCWTRWICPRPESSLAWSVRQCSCRAWQLQVSCRPGRQPAGVAGVSAARFQDECRRARPHDRRFGIRVWSREGSLAAQLARKNGQPVFVTLAERGIVGALPDQMSEHVPAHPIRGAIDIVGAGDAVTANLAAALAAGARHPRGDGTGHGRRLRRDSPTRDHRDGVGRSDR